MEADELETLELAAPLHDLGKIGLPDALLHKPVSAEQLHRKMVLLLEQPA